MDEVVTKLLSRIRLCISTSECQQHFDAAINHSFSDLSPIEKFKGITPMRKLLIIENAISLLQEFCEQHKHDHDYSIHMLPVVFKTLKSLIANSNVIDNSKLISSPSKVTNQTHANKPVPKPGDVDVKESTKKKKLSRVNRVQVEKPNSADLPGLYVKIKNDVIAGRAQQKQKHVTCSLKDCKFCLVMFQTVHLSACKAVHPKQKPCVPEGWYPHVGIGLWTRLKKYHDHRLPCKIKAVEPKPYEIYSTKLFFQDDLTAINGQGSNPDDEEADRMYSEIDWESEVSQSSVASQASVTTLASSLRSMLRDHSPLASPKEHSMSRRKTQVIEDSSSGSKRPKRM